MLIAFMVVAYSIPMVMRSTDSSPTEELAKLKGTPFWPGDWLFIRIAMVDKYLFANEAKPVNNLLSVWSADDVLQATMANCDYYSCLVSKEDADNSLAGKIDSIGFQYKYDDAQPMVRFVESSSLAARNGLVRGDSLLALNGHSATERKKQPYWRDEINSNKPFLLTVRSPNGDTREVAAQKQLIYRDPPLGRIVTTAKGRKVGYLFLRKFGQMEEKHLETIFNTFKQAGIHNLIVDLRYNGGGESTVSSKLANLTIGAGHSGKLYIQYRHSPRYKKQNRDVLIGRLPESLSVKRLVVITTKATASASESFIMGMKPHIKVLTVGEWTHGKPYSMEGIDFGDQQLRLITTRMYNSRGESWSGYAGIRADVPVEDDLTHKLGDPGEEMLKAALKALDGTQN